MSSSSSTKQKCARNLNMEDCLNNIWRISVPPQREVYFHRLKCQEEQWKDSWMKDWVLFRWWMALAKRLCHLKDGKSTQFLQKVTWLITHSLCHGGPGSPTSLQGVRLSPTNDAILHNLYSTTYMEYLLKVSLAPTNNNTSSWAQHMPWLAILV